MSAVLLQRAAGLHSAESELNPQLNFSHALCESRLNCRVQLGSTLSGIISNQF